MEYSNIEDLVRSHVIFSGSRSSGGWERLYCEVCGDGSKTKGPRGAWLFEDGGEICFYNCFNCGAEGNFDPRREIPYSKEMWNIFASFGISPKDHSAIVNQAKSSQGVKLVRRKKLELPRIDTVPDYFKPLNDFSEDDIIADEARRFIADNYHITQDDYPFYLSTGQSSTDPHMARHLRTRIIIPAFYREKMIFWQAREFVRDVQDKYVSASVKNSNNAVYGMDNLHRNVDRPLYITEGFFDSWHVNGIAVMTNKMKKGRIEIIERSPRPKVILPDQNTDGMNLADQGVELGWGVTFPKIYPETDVCKAIKRFGKLYVLKSIVDNTHHGESARIALAIFKNQNKIPSYNK